MALCHLWLFPRPLQQENQARKISESLGNNGKPVKPSKFRKIDDDTGRSGKQICVIQETVENLKIPETMETRWKICMRFRTSGA